MGKKFVVIGSAYVDYFCFIDGQLPQAGMDSKMDRPVQKLAGGSPINTATHLQHFLPQDAPPVIVSTVLNENDEDGNLLKQHAAENRYQIVNSRKHNAEATPQCVILVARGDNRSFLTYSGSAASWSAEEILLDDVPCHVHIAGFFSTPGFTKGDSLHEAMKRWREEYSSEISISLVTQIDNTGTWDGGLAANLIPLLDILIMNEWEASCVMSKQNASMSEDDEHLIASWLAFFSHPGVVFVVTMGEKGAIAFRNQTVVTRFRTPSDLVAIDSTGAGDAFAAGFLHGYYNLSPQGDVERALQWGCCVGSACVTIPGASTKLPQKVLDKVLQECGLMG